MNISRLLVLLILCIGLCISQCAIIKRSSEQESDNIIETYANFSQIEDWIYEQEKQYPHLINVHDIGKTHEGRPLLLMKIGWNSRIDKPAVWVDAGIHAREWISSAALLYALDQILSHSNDKYRSLLEKVDLYALPLVNPDGYEYTRLNSTTRLWRKNRRNNNDPSDETRMDCDGVDLNRNWGVGWEDLVMSSDKPCDEIYHGPKPMSEPEVKAISKFVLKHKQSIKATIHLHSFCQKILHCYGYSTDAPEGRDNEINLGVQVAQKILEVTGVTYATGASSTALYQYSGGCADWMAVKAGIPIAITMELRDTGDYGFLLPEDQIADTGTEVLIMVESAMDMVENMDL